ncbi:prenyltransferase/squalene oxidase repeat-containing protein [Sphaerisporangium perillae]|uniref:prenyltransferase/squalene oxidase repeat-containing protein n=1 Tax=Sphaerisporangium perillae TaxID=2935860 RepID=UPI0020107E92|nr:prenyltransferase/squalene oxidase repeat-containing protein [Sphaerisporangium perillae]
MNPHDLTSSIGAPQAVDVAAEAGALLAGLVARPWGDSSPSVYETGRLVALAPWLAGHHERLEYLMGTQRPDGGWGPHADYSLVPTLSATEALLAELVRCVRGAANAPDVHVHQGVPILPAVAACAGRGLRALFRWSRAPSAARLPDLPAIELIVPSLVASVNRRLDDLGDTPLAETPSVEGPGTWAGFPRLPLPEGLDGGPLERIRSRLRSGAPLPEKLLHALEVAGEAAFQAPAVRPTPAGTVGASPAATAAWLGGLGALDPEHPARIHLEAAAAPYGGPVSCAVPISAFERSWVLSWLVRAGVPVTVPDELVASLCDGLGPAGLPAGPGLPSDADTTSVALYTLALLGEPREPDSLWSFHAGTHFCTWQGEQGSSTTVNAHVLDAFGQYVVARPGARARYQDAMAALSGWLRDRQRADGSWQDRWHASPYYATACCALALDGFGGAESREAVRRAVRWVLSTQRADGSWGLWRGTAEETAYAVQLLLLTKEDPAEALREAVRREAVARGRAYLLGSARPGAPERPDDPPMWHDKDLYLPVAIVKAAVLGALHLAQRDLAVPAHRDSLVGKHEAPS